MNKDDLTPMRDVQRTYVLDDLHIRSDGDGRIVEAYAAVFNQRTEVVDQDGHYHEEINPKSFTRTLAHKGLNFGVLFNHGRTVDGTPNPEATMPIGVPVEIKADETGLFTATRYLNNPLADWVLDAIKHGALKSQSFSGRFHRSVRTYPDGRARSALPVITRHEVALREYGPAVFAAYDGAAILGTRAAETFVRSLLATPPEQRVQFLTQFEGLGTLLDSPKTDGTPPTGHAGTAEDAPGTPAHSAQSDQMRLKITAYRDRVSGALNVQPDAPTGARNRPGRP